MGDEGEYSEDSANDGDGGDASACGGRGPDAIRNGDRDLYGTCDRGHGRDHA